MNGMVSIVCSRVGRNVPLVRRMSSGTVTSGADKQKENRPRTGILMLNMGGPATLDEVGPFLRRLFTDRDIIPLPFQSILGPLIARRRTPSIREKYAEIGGGSPILKWTQQQGRLLCQLLDRTSPSTGPHRPYVGFRYTHPLTEDTLDQMEKDGIETAVAFSQYPQYSCATAGSSLNAISRYYATRKSAIKWRIIDRWPLNEGLIRCWTKRISAGLAGLDPSVRDKIVILFSAHSLPFSQMALGDPYTTEVGATVVRIMSDLSLNNPYRLVWQSKVGPVQWLEPKTEETITRLHARGHKHFMVVPVAFVNEHIETLHELDIEYGSQLVEKLGIETMIRIPTPNDDPDFVQGLADLVRDRLSSPVSVPAQVLLQCPMCEKESCKTGKQWLRNLAS